MRRGLIAWSREEVPDAAMAARVSRVQALMQEQNLDAVVAYTSFARPCAVSWLTHFVPYWNDGLTVVFREGLPVMLAAFSKRVEGWVREVSRVGEVVMTPNLGKGLADTLKAKIPALASGGGRIGIVEEDEFPWPVAEALVDAGMGHALLDATAQFAGVRQPADKAELNLASKALAMTNAALDAMPKNARNAAEILSAIDAKARVDGAEEVHMKLAPDLSTSAALQRIEYDARLGPRYAVHVSLGYKSTWIRTTRMIAAKAPASWQATQAWFDKALLGLHAGNLAQGPSTDGLKGTLTSWTLDACLGSHPYTAIAYGNAQGRQALRTLPGGALAALMVQVETPDGPWHGAAPLILGASEGTTRTL